MFTGGLKERRLEIVRRLAETSSWAGKVGFRGDPRSSEPRIYSRELAETLEELVGDAFTVDLQDEVLVAHARALSAKLG